MADNLLTLPKTKTSVDKFLDRDITTDTFVPNLILFTSLCTINVPFAFFYTSIFLYLDRYKHTNYEMYNQFLTTSIFIFSFFIVSVLFVNFIYMSGGINLHPNSSERPYFYFR